MSSIMSLDFSSPITWVWVMAAVLLGLWLLVRPRHGGSKAPPMVLSSKIAPYPLIGPLVEFAKSPVKMVRRCYDDYGPVYTVPVSKREWIVNMPNAKLLRTIYTILHYL
jgi:hypothetical protein